MRASVIALFVSTMILSALPVLAQQDASQRTLIIFGNDPCPAGVICVVAPETERYRIPKNLRQSKPSPENQSWAVRSQDTLEQGKAGAGSCSAIGSAGWTGCWAEEMRKAREEAKQAKEEDAVIP
jgi:hypothetical protein